MIYIRLFYVLNKGCFLFIIRKTIEENASFKLLVLFGKQDPNMKATLPYYQYIKHNNLYNIYNDLYDKFIVLLAICMIISVRSYTEEFNLFLLCLNSHKFNNLLFTINKQLFVQLFAFNNNFLP